MRSWKGIAVFGAIVAAIIAFFVFRPERLVVNQRVNEPFPVVTGTVSQKALASGSFHSVVHDTEGTATVYQLHDGSRVLRLTAFKTSNGPDVHIYMVAASDARDNASVPRAGFIDLGTIKGNIGDQNYAIGPDVDLSKYRAVSVWCKRFNVNFGAAPLTRPAPHPLG